MSKNVDKSVLFVKVSSPRELYYEGEALSVTAVNETGEFDVLPQHHNFITLLSPCNLQIINSKGTKEVKIDSGIMHVKDDNITVLLDI